MNFSRIFFASLSDFVGKQKCIVAKYRVLVLEKRLEDIEMLIDGFRFLVQKLHASFNCFESNSSLVNNHFSLSWLTQYSLNSLIEMGFKQMIYIKKYTSFV